MSDTPQKISRLKRLVLEIEEQLKAATPYVNQPYSPLKSPDGISRSLQTLSKELLGLMEFKFESKGSQRLYTSIEDRMEALKEMLKQYRKQSNGENLWKVLHQQSDANKTYLQRYQEHAKYLTSFVEALDDQHISTLSIGSFRVVLYKRKWDWDKEGMSVLTRILDRTEKALQRAGLASLAGGTVYAFRASYLPPTVAKSETYAIYRPSDDTISVAVVNEQTIDLTVRTMIHEIGHRAYAKRIGTNGRREWETFFGTNQGTPPNVDKLIADWEAHAQGKEFGQYMDFYLHDLYGKDEESAMWLTLTLDSLNIDEKLAPYGLPDENSVSGLEQLKARKSEAKVFLYPVTAYSGTNPEELFAEVFATICLKGHSQVHPLLRKAFYQALPQFKVSKSLCKSLVKTAHAHLRHTLSS
jgi:hypothetical protein